MIKSKKLIISLDTYSWVKFCCGLILENFSDFHVMILHRDNGLNGILDYPNLCAEAVRAQRKHDLTRLGKKLGIKKLYNLNYGEYIDVEQLSINLNLQSMLNGVDEIYCQNDSVVSPIIGTIGNTFKLKVYYFGEGMKSPKKTIHIEKYYSKIYEVQSTMIGVSERKQLDFPKIEKFY